MKHELIKSNNQYSKERVSINEATIKSIVPGLNKFVKGACENCGSLTHQKRDCFERPRAKGAKFTGKNLANNEFIQEKKLNFEAAHDYWNGYDPSTQLKLLEEFKKIEEEKLNFKLEKLKQLENLTENSSENYLKLKQELEKLKEDDEEILIDDILTEKDKINLKQNETLSKNKIEINESKKIIELESFVREMNDKNKNLKVSFIY